MKFFKSLIFILVFYSLSSFTVSAETGYEVELIIFEDTQSRYLKSEDWNYNDMLNNSDIASSTFNIENDAEFKELNWDNAKLEDSLEKIKSSSKYNVLITKRWRQTGLDRDKAYYMKISSLPKNVAEDGRALNDSDKSLLINTSEIVVDKGSSEQLGNKPQNYIEGRVKLVMSRYLHFEINLNYFKWQDNENGFKYISYPIISERRMKSREIHYLDHPMIGVIVLTTPYKIEMPLDTVNRVSLDNPVKK